MKPIRLVAVAFLLAVAGSCTTATAPVGETPLGLDPGQWEGNWTALLGEDRWPVSIQVLDAESGVLEVTNLFQEDAGRRRTVYLRQAAGWVFASTLADQRASDPEERPPVYQWARVDANPSRILFWSPVATRFRNLVDEGRLPAPAPESRADIGPLGPEAYELLRSEDGGSLFEWDDPGVLVRDRE